MNESYTLVTTPAQLDQFLGSLQRHQSIALDTEADSLHHYHEKLCLMQLTAGGEHWLVDPLSENLDLTPLVKLLERRDLIMHGADYDLRLMHRAYQFRPWRIFDTMIAAQILGRRQIGLAALVEEVSGVELSKHGQRADWSVRPLSQDLLEYAVLDVRYLHRLADQLTREMREKGRLSWHSESCERLLKQASKPKARPDEDPWRIKGGRNFEGRAGAVLRELWRWREQTARRADVPPFKVANNQFLLQWPTWIEANPQAGLEETPPIPAWLRGRRRSSFERALERALGMPPDEWPDRRRRRRGQRLRPHEEECMTKLLKARGQVAGELEIDPGVLAPRDAIKSLIRILPRDEQELFRKSPLMNWQNKCLAEEFIPILLECRKLKASAEEKPDDDDGDRREVAADS